MKSIEELHLQGKTVLLRADFNVPLDSKQQITDDIRIRMVLPTINHIIDRGGKLIICSHLGRPKGKRVTEFSLAPVAEHLQSQLDVPVILAPDCVGPEVEAVIKEAPDKVVILLENLRFHPQETTNDPVFAKALAAVAEVYVNDAFAVSHRAHASVVGVAEKMAVKGAGFLLHTEMDYFTRAMENPVRPLLAIIGGAKVSSKLAALENMLDRVDGMIIGGAMANTFLKAMDIEVGDSKVEEDLLVAAQKFIEAAKHQQVKLYFPVDFVIAQNFAADVVTKQVPYLDIPPGWMALDTGPASATLFRQVIEAAGTIVWNGPLGAFEMDPFARGTMAVCRDIGSSHALSIVGGGDSNAALKKAGEERNVSYMSTGGGAFLQLMEGKTLPGVVALDS